MSARFAAKLPFGAQALDRERTRFRVWAPSARSARVLLDDEREASLEREADGWFSATVDAAPGSVYRYRFDDAEPVPDPAARAQKGGVHGSSVVVDAREYEWRNDAWRGRPWHETVLYELHVGALGGYSGVSTHFERLRALGVTAIELMPIAEFPGRRGWGYDGVLPFAPSSAYGTPAELKAMIDAAHGAGLMVFLDVVYNHFGPEGNRIGEYAAPFFRDDIATPWGRAIDFRREEVRGFFIANATYWIDEYRFDGLRVDAVHAIEPNDWLTELATRVRAGAGARHVHLVLENDANDPAPLASGFDAQWNDDFHHAAHVHLTGERESYYADYADEPARALARCLAEGFAYQGEFSRHRNAMRGGASAALPPSAFIAFLQNHDQVGNRALGERLHRLADAEAIDAATALLLLCPQIPLLWMGEEWASERPFLFFCDFEPPLADAVREGRAREFEAFSAFGGSRTRLPDPNAADTFVASSPALHEAETERGRAEIAKLRTLLALRRDEIVPFIPRARSLGADVLGPGAVTARWRLGAGRALHVFVNLGNADVEANAPDAGRMLYASRAGGAERLREGTLIARAFAAWIVDHGD